jgi:hypothetical protein
LSSIRTLLAALLIGAALACGADPIAPSPAALAGRWRLAVPQSPSGQYARTLDFTADGQYVLTGSSRGIYAQLPADSVGSISWEYGTYVVNADTLRFAQDSVRSWDYLGGTYFHAGPRGQYFEGPPTDPIIELTSARLTLHYMVNPGAGYLPVTDVYLRAP